MKYIFPLLFVLFIFFSKWYENLHNLQLLGISLDIIGAYYLAQGFIVKTKKEILRDSHGVDRSMSTNLAVSFYIQKYEAITGFTILTGGFLLQGYSTIHPDLEMNSAMSVGLIIGLFSLVSIIHQYIFKDERILKLLKLD